MKDGSKLQGVGATFRRLHFDSCYGNDIVSKWYRVGDGQVTKILTDYINITKININKYLNSSVCAFFLKLIFFLILSFKSISYLEGMFIL